MGDGNRAKPKKPMVVKVVIPILLVCAVVSIWAIKNYGKEKNPVTTKTTANIAANSKLKNADSPDFELLVTEKIDLEKLKSYGIPIVIDFGSQSCSACKEMAPVLEELNSELKGKAILKFVDVWKYRELTQGYPVSLIPTQIFIAANGKPYKPEDPQALQMKQLSSEDTGEHIFTAHEGGLTKEQLLGVLKEMGMQ